MFAQISNRAAERDDARRTHWINMANTEMYVNVDESCAARHVRSALAEA